MSRTETTPIGTALGPAWRAYLRPLRAIPGLRSTWQLLVLLHQARQGHRAADYDQDFRSGSDPWNYISPAHQQRFQDALAMFSQAGRDSFESALEIGCAEGAFTLLLAQRCRRLLAGDVSELALRRAAELCAEFGDVEFRKFDIREETGLGPFDLVVAMDVLPYFRRPQELRSAVRNIVQALSADGHLLLSVTRPLPGVLEDTWWSRWVPRGQHILDFVARSPHLVELFRRTTVTHYLALYQRSGQK